MLESAGWPLGGRERSRTPHPCECVLLSRQSWLPASFSSLSCSVVRTAGIEPAVSSSPSSRFGLAKLRPDCRVKRGQFRNVLARTRERTSFCGCSRWALTPRGTSAEQGHRSTVPRARAGHPRRGGSAARRGGCPASAAYGAASFRPPRACDSPYDRCRRSRT